MKSQPSKALPPVKEIFQNGHSISDAIREKINNESISAAEAKEIIEELDECILLMQNLKKSLKEK